MNILITGASRGIGYSIVKSLAKDPAHRIVVLTRSTEELLKRIRSEPEFDGSNVAVHYFDLIKFSEADLSFLQTDIDVLINNAGQLINKSFEDLDDADWRLSFETNVLGPAKLVRGLLPLLGKNGPSHIVNIGSMGGFQGSSKFPGLSAYSSSKAALANLSECLAEELKDRNIFSNCLCLGAVVTDMLRLAFPDYKAPTSSDEMGGFIADFALNGFRFFNGKTIPVAVSTP